MEQGTKSMDRFFSTFKRSLLKLFITLLQLVAFNTYLNAQQPFHYSINDENGLPSNEVYQLVQDKNGYIWLGCDAGLYRYDGIQFKAYKNDLQNGRSISNLVLDVEGYLWCRNFNGQLFRVVNDSLKLIVDDSKSANKFQICYSDEPGFWRVDNEYLSQHDASGELIFKHKLNIDTELIGTGTDMLFHDGKIWIEIANKGLYCFEIKKKKLTAVFPVDQGISYQNQRLFVNQNRLILMRSESAPSIHNYLYMINTADFSYQQFYYFMNPIQIRNYHFYEDSKHRLWISSSFGAICIPQIYLFTAPEMICFTGHQISSVLEDQEGNYWFSDLQKGLHFVPDPDINTLNKTVDIAEKGEISALKSIDPSTIVIGHYDGSIGFYNPITKKCDYPEEINQHKGITVKEILQENGLLYISRGHLLIYDIKKKKSRISEHFGNSRKILIHKDQMISIHPEQVVSMELSQLLLKNSNPVKILNRGGRSIVIDPKTKDLYLALNDGLHLQKGSKTVALKFENQAIHASVLSSGKNAVYAGTQNQGILEIKNGKVTRRFIYPTDLQDITIRALFNAEHYLWACTNSDFLRINLKTGKWQKYSRNIGINPKDVNAIGINGKHLYIGSKKLLLSIPLNHDPVNWIRPKIHLTKVTFDQNKQLNSKRELPYDFSNLRFDFNAISFRSRSNLTYTYRLIGFDTTWTVLNHENPTVTFSSLPAGKYTFQVKALNESDLSGNTVNYSFEVLSPIWQKAWFYLLITLLSLSVMALIFHARIKAIRKRNEFEKKLVNSQLSALKAQMNPHFMYNALNSIQALILKQDIKNSNLYLSKFSNLMRKVLDASGKEYISLEEETAILHLYLDLEKLRFGDEFNFSIHVENDLDSESIILPSMILQPYVENALKHGLLHKKGEKNLKIQFKLLHEHLICVIRDNGVGRDRSAEIKARFAVGHKSFASEATEKRVELLNTFVKEKYEVEINDLFEDELATGTEVIIRIPLNIHSES